MTDFNYKNWKSIKDEMEKSQGYALVQAWTTEYYQHLMNELEKRLSLLLGVEKPDEYVQGKIDLLQDILYDT